MIFSVVSHHFLNVF